MVDPGTTGSVSSLGRFVPFVRGGLSMMFRSGAGGAKTALAVAATVGTIFFGCIDRPTKLVTSITQSGVSEEVTNDGIDRVDLLLMVDNSNSMRENQSNIMMQFSLMINTLTTP